ncbi:SDR family NAD(P)-dependent oxidoreductase [Mariprofundus ferrooxydans]|uniref:Probable dehydrogenase/reductase oxidoreductase protein n=1 Tax=Mariprofundus ferrooxydans PV-1 TaxID=314345 RepID=Q0F1T6_9PROT|nr:SDR family NAD(P)-dependent oxidoreductase [Mariprofundus ferrooxydans]EAU55814.1 probable dehydrogenase/reductase oxidoreductase protein [Mariprofundus ferrooxydans PV-1]KON47959.1 reductase oxidoreductase [Mariprofundus ferrooxydans]
MSELTGQGLVLITGASGGFGLEFSRQLEARGYNLLLHGRDKARLQMTLSAMRYPDRHRLILADLNAKSGLTNLLADADSASLTGLVNNAGFGIWGSFEQTGIVPQIDVIKTDLKAPIALTHALLPSLLKSGGFIINVSSLAGVTPLPYMSTYAAAKAGLTYWSEALRTELAGRIRVVTLAPGPSPTGFRDVSGMPAGKGSFFRTAVPDIITACLKTLDHGGGYCIPGWRHRLLYTLQKITPGRWALRIMSKQLRP